MTVDKVELNATLQSMNAAAMQASASVAEVEFSEVIKSATLTGVDLDGIFNAAAQKHNVPVNLLKAVAKAESDFRPNVTSSCGAMGIMQLMPATAKSLGVIDAYDPEQNIMGGAKYLSQMLTRFGGNVEFALAAYNAGPGAVAKYDGIPPYNETQNYVKKVMEYMGSDISVTGLGHSIGGASGTAENSLLKSSLTEMFMMKMLELEMKSSDDDKDKPIF